MSNPSSSTLSRDELAHLLGASQSSDILATRTVNRPAATQAASRREEDVSSMDRVQAAALVARQFDKKKDVQKRHRATKKMEHHLLAADVEEAVNDEAPAEEQEEDAFANTHKRRRVEAAVLHTRRRADSSTSSSDESSSDESSRAPRRRRGSSSSEASDDSADLRRQRARERRQRSNAPPVALESEGEAARVDSRQMETETNHLPSEHDVKRQSRQPDLSATVKTKPDLKREESSSSSDSESSSSVDSSSEESSDQQQPLSKPLFVPKSKRGTIAEQEMQQQKQQHAEQRREEQKQKRTLQSRALVAEAVAEPTTMAVSTIGEEDEFEGSQNIIIPDDTDPHTPESMQYERDTWEVRELLRLLYDADRMEEVEREKVETERRRNMTDREVFDEGYLRPGEERRKRNGGKYLQKFHHRGAFYLDEDTLEQAGEDDVRHKAAEYSRAATGEDKIDKSALPEVMQVKKFGFAGYSTKYKGLAKEDTTDKQLDFVPIQSKTTKKNS